MTSKEEIECIVINQYRKYIKKGSNTIVIGRAFIPLDMVVNFIMDETRENDQYLHSAMFRAIEYFSS